MRTCKEAICKNRAKSAKKQAARMGHLSVRSVALRCHARIGRPFRTRFAPARPKCRSRLTAFACFGPVGAPPAPGRLCSRFAVTLALGGLLGPASPLRGPNAAHACGVRLFWACRASGSGPPMLALRCHARIGRPSRTRFAPARPKCRSRLAAFACFGPVGAPPAPARLCLRFGPQGLRPMPPSRVRVSPVRYLKSGLASWTHTRPISNSGSP